MFQTFFKNEFANSRVGEKEYWVTNRGTLTLEVGSYGKYSQS